MALIFNQLQYQIYLEIGLADKIANPGFTQNYLYTFFFSDTNFFIFIFKAI